jgi:hypothetical protein
VPTYDRTDTFKDDYSRLTSQEKRDVNVAVRKFLEDLPTGKFRAGLRVKGIKSAEGVLEMTWSGDGRMTFEYGKEVHVGQPHIIWRRVGRHEVLDDA